MSTELKTAGERSGDRSVGEELKIWMNGEFVNRSDAKISVFDHGFLYGEGVYETLRTYNRRPFLYDRHVRRLRNSATMLVLDLPFTAEELAAEIERTMAAADLGGGEAYIRVLVTRGIGDLSYDPRATPTPSPSGAIRLLWPICCG